MFDKFIDFLLNFLDQALPVKMIKTGCHGILYRGGPFRALLQPGFHFKIPFIDILDVYSTNTTTMPLQPQSIVTADGRNVVVRAVIKYRIEDLGVFAVKVYDATDALADITAGIVFDVVHSGTWEDIKAHNLSKMITPKDHKEAKLWGVNVESVTITDLAEMRSIRLLGTNPVNTSNQE